jgi:hypothetical protein
MSKNVPIPPLVGQIFSPKKDEQLLKPTAKERIHRVVFLILNPS